MIAVDNDLLRGYIHMWRRRVSREEAMAIRAEIQERTPLENAEMEYEREPGRRKQRRPGFNRARLLDLMAESVEIGAREAFQREERVSLTMHVKGVRDFVKVQGKVRKCTRVNILRQPAFAIFIEFDRLDSSQVKKLSWARDQLVPKRRPVRLKREEETPAPTPAPTPTPAPAANTRETTPPEKVVPPPETTARIRRPVALLELIDGLDRFEVTSDLVLAIIEAAEAGMDVEVLYPQESARPQLAEGEPAEEETVGENLPGKGQARPMNVYRLARNTQLYFSEEGRPVGPAAELIYLSRLQAPESCFAVVLELDTMFQPGTQGFKRGSILLFSTTERVDSGDFAFVKSRSGDEFAQVFFDKQDSVRIRLLNPKYRERVVRRSEVRLLCKLVGHYEDLI